MKREDLLALAAEFNAAEIFDETFMISALKGDGVADILSQLAGLLPEGPWMFPEDQLSDLPQRLMAAEVTREYLFLQTHQEVPYSTTVETESWEEFKDGSVKIEQTIYVQRDCKKRSFSARKARVCARSVPLRARSNGYVRAQGPSLHICESAR